MRKLLFLAVSIVTWGWLSVEKASAQIDFWGINDLSGLAVGTRTIGDTIAGVINIALGFLGVIAIGLIIYGGFLWMTSRGNSERIQRAKLLITSAVIGLAIVLSAYAITQFILSSLDEATGGPGGSGGPGGPGLPGVCPPPGDGTTIEVCNPAPLAAPIGSYVTIYAWNIGPYVDATTSRVEFSGPDNGSAELAVCTGSPTWVSRGSVGADNYYQIVFRVPDLSVTSGYTVDLYNSAGGPFSSLSTFEILGGAPYPGIACVNPSEGPPDPAMGNLITIDGVGFGPAPTELLMHAWVGGVEDTAYITPLSWIDSWGDDQITYYVPTEALTGPIRVHVGTHTSNPWQFKVTCSADGQCASSCCPGAPSNGACYPYSVCNAVVGGPTISGITPDNSAANDQNLVTIYGSGFGTYVAGISQVNFAGGVIGMEPNAVNPQCSNFWNDNFITIIVPSGASTGNVTVTNGSGQTSNAHPFTVNGIDRPGICAVTSDSAGTAPVYDGYFQDTVYLHGLNMSPVGTTYFGDFESPVSNLVSAEEIETEVPNILGNVGIVYDNGEESNPYPFTVFPGTSGTPVINEIIANEVLGNSGPAGQYITVYGANFGATPGDLIFSFGGTDYSADFSFPPQCSTNIWRHDTIIAKVPNAAGNIGTFQVRVERPDGAYSNNYAFNKTTGVPGPGLCALIPTNGPQGMLVDAFGDNFELAPGANGDLEFYSGVSTAGTWAIWNNSQILDVPVPSGAISGPVVVYNDTDPNPSNPIDFTVGSCSVNSDCTALGYTNCCTDSLGANYCANSCAPTLNQCHYGWTFRTESALSIIDRGPVCNDACINSLAWVNFDSEISGAFLNDTYFSIYSCGTDPTCAAPDMTNNLVDAAMGPGDMTGPLVHPSTGQNYWAVNIPMDPLTAEDYYIVEIDQSIENTLGATMGPDPLASWTFGVGLNNCLINNVSINPIAPTVYLGSSQPYQATAWSAPGVCYPTGQPLACVANADPTIDCSWSWVSDNAPVASIPNIDDPMNTAIANDVGTANIRATANQGSGHISPPSNITVITGPLTIRGHGPDCGDACTNALTYVDFNNELAGSVYAVISNYIEVNRCLDADCTTFDPTNEVQVASYVAPSVANPNHRYYLETVSGPIVYDPGTKYRLFVSGTTEDIYGTLLGTGAEYIFGVGDGPCLIENVEVSPATANLYIGEAQPLTAIGRSAPDSCSAVGQAISCVANANPAYNCSWSWDSGDPLVATIPNLNSSTNVTGAVGIGSTLINANANQGIGPIITTGSATVNVNTHANPSVYDNLPIGAGACPNGAVSVAFTEIMDRNSIYDNFKLYQRSTVDIPELTCIVNGDYYCEVPVDRYAFEDDQSIYDTKVSLYPDGYLATSTPYVAMVYGGPSGVLSREGMDLDAADMVYDIDGGGADGFGWTFTTLDQPCNIGYTILSPSWDIFTCFGNDCASDGDVNPTGGNQHIYTAYTYDIRGHELTVDQHKWSVALGYVTGVPTATTTSNQIEGTSSNNNGTETLSVTVSDSDPDVLGRVSDTSRIDLYLCENPWPSPTGFPWTPTGNGYNYSTYYCHDSGIEGAEVLPYINPATGPTTPNPDGVLPGGEHIFLINNLTSAVSSNLADSGFGTLAYKSDHIKVNDSADEEKWYQKITRNVFGFTKAEAQEGIPGEFILDCTPAPPANMHVVAASDTQIELDWNRPGVSPIPTYYRIQRRIVGQGTWTTLINNRVPTDYIDNNGLVAGTEYEYRGWSFYQGGTFRCPDSYWSLAASNPISQIASSEEPTFDLIGIRVVGNPEHLSVSDWYQRFAPNPSVSGNLIEVDGYEALQVGNTTYIAGTNIRGGLVDDLYTNIYIIAHNEGASAGTQEIYSQMVANMELNVNIDGQNNVCSITTEQACSTDFDCPTGESCLSRGLKLRRDTKRLADLVHIKNAIEVYGESHKACSTAPERSCSENVDCASVGGLCINMYPVLDSGTFVENQSNSNWPESWHQNFPDLLSVDDLPGDPVGIFNGCPDETMPGGPADPDTCWNETDRIFTCPMDSLIYLYNNYDDSGVNYFLGANFEYDMDLTNGTNFRDDLINVSGLNDGVYNIPHLEAMLDGLCRDNTYSPGPVTIPLCGNGVVDAGEECDGGFRELCDAMVGPGDWWNEQLGGCNLPGTPDECTWYEPTTPLTAADCGGYCGNTNIDIPYENCDGALFDGLYTCYYPDTQTFGTPNCDGDICQPICPATGNLAARCGDGYWDPEREQCDGSALPDGLAGWDCSGGTAFCGTAGVEACRIQCTTGVLYGGECGDGVVDAYCDNDPSINCADDPTLCLPGGSCIYYEQCEPDSWVMPAPGDSDATHQYLCDPVTCQTFGGYCGDTMPPYPGGNPPGGFYQPEQCDFIGYVSPPDPRDSTEDWQYECFDDTAANPCTIGGGWCGDGIVRDDTGSPQSLLDMNLGTPESCDDQDSVDTNVCTNNCAWTCSVRQLFGAPPGTVDDDPIEDMLIAPSILDSTEGLLFDNVSPTIDLYTGDSTELNLRECRVSGPLAVDVTIENNESYAGIVFVSDLSGSMGGAGVSALRNAIAGPGNALDSILDRNPGAMVSLVHYSSAAYVDSGFVNIAEEIETLRTIVNNYTTGGGTEHDQGLLKARELLQGDYFENSIVIFMTDGVCSYDYYDSCYQSAMNQAEAIKYDPIVGINGKIFTVALTGDARLRGYMNTISSATDYCSYINNGVDREGTCGGVNNLGVNCYSLDSVVGTRNVWEQCDPAVDADCYGPGAQDAGGNYVECRWTPDSIETNYFYTGDAAALAGMYQDISGSIPVNTIELDMTFLESGGTGAPTSVVTDGTYYIDTRSAGFDCIENDPNNNIFTLEATFNGNPNAYLRLSNPRYLFCPWNNCEWCD